MRSIGSLPNRVNSVERSEPWCCVARLGGGDRICYPIPMGFFFEEEWRARILPLAREKSINVIVNRPFREGELIRKVKRHPLPAWAGEIDCANWAQVLLKFIVSHPAVTCAIPATTRVDHVRENIGAAFGRMPDEAMRARIAAHVEPL